MKISIYNLVIEATRRCNIQCNHCLRGRAQNKNIKKQYVDSLFSKIDYVSILTISGGEPSIAVDSINKIIDSAIENNVEIGSFYIATNGKKITYPFVKAVERLHSFCSDNDISGVDISNDIYHDEIEDTDAFNYLLTFPYVKYKWNENIYPFNRKFDRNGKYIYSEGSIINSGLALENGIGHRNAPLDFIEIEETEEEFIISEGNIYLNCMGNIISGCDYSYEDQDSFEFENLICKVDDLSIKTVNDFIDKMSVSRY